MLYKIISVFFICVYQGCTFSFDIVMILQSFLINIFEISVMSFSFSSLIAAK